MALDDRDFTLLKARIESLLGLNLNDYKPVQVRRRLDAFISRRGFVSAAAFASHVARDAPLREALHDMLTINVTEFFRDTAQWQELQRTVLPQIAAAARSPRIWSAGCSNGGEAYTVAILLAELGIRPRGCILGTDIDRKVLAQARQGGPYTATDIRSVPTPYLQNYFQADGNEHKIAASLRRQVAFREFNLLTGRFDSGFDLILCRNVIIYFTDAVKKELLARFHASLAPDGVLFIGATESILGADALGYERLGGNFYRKRPAGQIAA